MKRRDHRLGVPSGLAGEALHGLGLAGARVAPQQHRNSRAQQDLHRIQRLLLGYSHDSLLPFSFCETAFRRALTRRFKFSTASARTR